MEGWIKADPNEKPGVIHDVLWSDGSVSNRCSVDDNIEGWQDYVAKSIYFEHITHWRPSK